MDLLGDVGSDDSDGLGEGGEEATVNGKDDDTSKVSN
jgi:hypothetical protein